MKNKLFFSNKKGDKLCGVLSERDPKKAIILCHGFLSSKNSKTYLCLEEALNKSGLTTFRFDFFGHGESQGKIEDITVTEATEDILFAVDYLKEKGYENIGLVGSSFGGLAAIIAASKRNDLSFLVLKSPVSDLKELELFSDKEKLKEWKVKGYGYYNGVKINGIFYKDCLKNNGYEVAKKINIPTLIIHGDEDKDVPFQQSQRLNSLIENSSLKIIRGADHRYSKKEDFQEMVRGVEEFTLDKI